MNKQDVIDWQLAQLSNQTSTEPTDEMQQLIANTPGLQQELSFIVQFWTSTEQQKQPSAALDSGFYRMLSQAQGQLSTPTKPSVTSKPHALISRIQGWFSIKPMWQFATLGLVFALGLNVDRKQEQTPALAGLQQQVSSLSSLVALSMLQKSSAPERLSGVAYSRQSDLSNPELMATLITMLGKDKSSAVRLAIISSMSSAQNIDVHGAALISIAVNESNILVQMELCRLLLEQGSAENQAELLIQLAQIQLDPDVQDFIDKIMAPIYI
jgi:hypothetical protein